MSRYTKKYAQWYWTAQEEAELLRGWPDPVIPGRSSHAVGQHAAIMGLPPRKPGRPVRSREILKGTERDQTIADATDEKRQADAEKHQKELGSAIGEAIGKRWTP